MKLFLKIRILSEHVSFSLLSDVFYRPSCWPFCYYWDLNLFNSSVLYEIHGELLAIETNMRQYSGLIFCTGGNFFFFFLRNSNSGAPRWSLHYRRFVIYFNIFLFHTNDIFDFHNKFFEMNSIVDKMFPIVMPPSQMSVRVNYYTLPILALIFVLWWNVQKMGIYTSIHTRNRTRQAGNNFSKKIC